MSENLHGVIRPKLGTRSARILRLQGRVPACVQGEGKAHINLSLERDEFLAARRRNEHLFDIALDEGETETAMVRELQWDAFGDNIVHVEFRRVIRGQQTEAEVTLKFRGVPKGGILNQLVSDILVLAIPSKIPSSIEVKVGELEPGDAIFAGDLEMPEGATLGSPPDLQVAVVVTPRGLAEDTPAEAEEGLEPEEGAEDAPKAEDTED